MSFNNFYNNFRGNNFTFQSNFTPQPCVPPPPPPPPYFVPPLPWNPEISDQKYLNSIEANISSNTPIKIKSNQISISEVHEKLFHLVHTLNNLKSQEKFLENNMNILTEEAWEKYLQQINENKNKISNWMIDINDSYLDTLRKVLAKRTAKRLRLKKVRLEKKREKEEQIKESEEKSRKIDENLQKIKDDISKKKQEEEAKLQADIVLKEVLRKKTDAKKCVVKLDALIKLRKARQNTAKGRGEIVAEAEALAFNNNIEKLKTLWMQKLFAYEKEETELRSQLKQDNEELNTATNETENEVLNNLSRWREVLFGGNMPQVNFNGDIGRFVAVRSKWDKYISSEGTSLPIGWVPPTSS